MKWMSFCPFDVMSRKTKRKNHFSFKLYRQACGPVWTFLVSKVDPLIANSSKQKPPS